MGDVPATGEAAARLARTCALSDGASRLRFVTPARADALDRIGIRTVRDVLLHVPSRYLDFTQLKPIIDARVGSVVTVVARVDRVVVKRPRPRMVIVEVSVVDETGVLVASFFKQPWVADAVHVNEVIALSGKVGFDFGFKQMRSPFYEVVEGAADPHDLARVLPVHGVTEGLSPAWMRRIVSAALADLGDVADPVPASLRVRHGLMSLGRAFREVHFPASVASAEQARRRLAYDELLSLQLALLARQRIELEGIEPVAHVTDGIHLAALRAALPFSLTNEQQVAASEILYDMASPTVMNRLLLGDVGTGKTAVAALALAAVADSGTQAAMMAPTSVLARQYAEKLGPLLDEASVSWALVTGATPAAERADAEDRASRGKLDVVFGTTAVLSEGLAFRHLSLVVIDEQHRFGVDQRQALRRKGLGADLLTMTATPIPRTLALSVYGDISSSVITTRPRAGAGVTTKLVTPENVDLAYTAIREAVAAGHQAYVICPLVEDTDTSTDLDSDLDDVPPEETAGTKRLHSAVTTSQVLSRDILSGLNVGLLTGRMSATEKDEVMGRFRDGSVDVLVATTVVEVGVDVPNATVMLVWDADRFGLATLHQLRGRVGRGDVPGSVFLASAARKGTKASERLGALERTSDGFALASLDLKLRREGEVLGYRQHGGVTLRLVDLEADSDLVEAAHEEARELVSRDPSLEGVEAAPLGLEVRERYRDFFSEVDGA